MDSVSVKVNWQSAQPIDRLEIVRDGKVVEVIRNADQKLSGQSTLPVDVSGAGWLAARCWGKQRTKGSTPRSSSSGSTRPGPG